MASLPGIIPRYPNFKSGWYAKWVPPGIPVGTFNGFSYEPVFFTEQDESVSIIWPDPSTTPHFQVYVNNPLTGEPEESRIGMHADADYPDTGRYTFYNAGGKGYITTVGTQNASANVILETERTQATGNMGVTINGTPQLPDAAINTAYSYAIALSGTQPITLNVTDNPPWMDVELVDGDTIQFSGTPTASATNVNVAFTLSNPYGPNVDHAEQIDVSNTAITGTKFGVIIGTPDSTSAKVTVAQAMGLEYMRGTKEALSTYYAGKGNSFYTACKARGMKMIHNVHWNNNASPTNQFCHDETLYKQKFNLMLDDYGDDTSTVIVLVIENEADNANYYGDTMANYITMLGWAIEVCHARSPQVKVADSCTHVLPIMQGATGRTGQIISGINNLRIAGKVLDYVNLHTNLSAGADARKIIEAAAYLRAHTGITNVISNEWHSETEDTTTAVQAVADSRTANLIYSIVFGGECPQEASNKAMPLNCGTTLTQMGMDIRDAIGNSA